MTPAPNTISPEAVQTESVFPPLPTIVPLRTAAMDAFLTRPVTLHGLSARHVLAAVGHEHYDATRERRMFIEGALTRLEDLRERLIAKLDSLDADENLEPFLSATEGWNQRWWGDGTNDDRECEDREPNLSATEAADQRAWSKGGATDLEWDRADYEPSMGWANPQAGTPTPWLTDGGRGEDREDMRL